LNRRDVAELIIGILLLPPTLMLLELLGTSIPTALTWNRVTVFYASPPLHETVYILAIAAAVSIALTLLLVAVSRGRCRASASILALSTAAVLASLACTSAENPLARILLGVVLVPYVAYLLLSSRAVARGFFLALATYSAVYAAVFTGFLAGVVPKDVAWSTALVWRSFWRVLEYSTPLMLIFAGLYNLYQLLRKGVKDVQELCRTPSTKPVLRIVLTIALLTPTLVVLALHSPVMNPGMKPVSVDTYYYWRFFLAADRFGLSEALAMTRAMARPLYLIALYSAYKAVQDPVLLLDILHPIAALTMLVASSYIAAKRFCPKAALLAALLTALGPNVVTFIAGGFQANSIALPLAILALSIDAQDLRGVSTKALLYLAVALIHPWTYVMYAAAEALLWLAKRDLHRFLLFTSLLLLIHIVSEAVANTLVAGASPTVAVTKTLSHGLSLGGLRGVVEGMELWTWGSMENPFIGVAAALATSYTLPVAAPLAVSAPIALVAKPGIVLRILLNIPLGLLAAIGLAQRSREVVLAVTIAAIAQTLSLLCGLTPLEVHPPLENPSMGGD